MHSTPALSLVDTTVTYGYCKQRLEQLGGDVLGSIRFACPLRAEHVEVLYCHLLVTEYQRQAMGPIKFVFEWWSKFATHDSST